MITNDVFPQQDSSTSDATLRAFDDDEYISERDPLDSSDLLASLLETATVALNTDRRVTQKCIRRAAVLLGIDLSRREDATAERSHLQGGLAPWQARRLKKLHRGKNSTRHSERGTSPVSFGSARATSFAPFVRPLEKLQVAYIMKRRMLRAQELMLKSRVSLSQVALECGHVRSGSFLTHVSSDRRNQSHSLAAVNYFGVLHSVRTHPEQPSALRRILRRTVLTPLLSWRR